MRGNRARKRCMARWALVFAFLAVLSGAACQKSSRCPTCGMKIDPASAWVSYVILGNQTSMFDTPRCALTAWQKDRGRAQGARFREYYSQEVKDAAELRFVAGSDVVGPMGPELVPVIAEKAARFARDHNGAPPKSAEELLQELP
jgi:copper chaperone NosL